MRNAPDVDRATLTNQTVVDNENGAVELCWLCVGGLLELKLAGCDGGQKEKGSGPENVLLTSWSCSQTRNYHLSLCWIGTTIEVPNQSLVR